MDMMSDRVRSKSMRNVKRSKNGDVRNKTQQKHKTQQPKKRGKKKEWIRMRWKKMRGKNEKSIWKQCVKKWWCIKIKIKMKSKNNEKLNKRIMIMNWNK